MFNSLRSGNGAMVFMTATMAVIIATTSPASAWGFDWFAPVSNWLFGTAEETVLTDYSAGTTSGSYLEDAMTLVEQKYTLRNENYETKIFLADTVKEFRSNGANEDDVSHFLDELDYEFDARLYEKNNGLILTSATAGYAFCPGPQAVPCAAVVTVAVLAQGLWMLSPQGQNAIAATKSWVASHMSSSGNADEYTSGADHSGIPGDPCQIDPDCEPFKLGSNEPNTGTNKNAGQSPKYGHARSAHGSQNNQAKIRARFNDPYASSHQGHFSNNKMIEEAYNTAIQRYSTGYSSQGNWVVHVKVSRASYVYTRGGGTYTTKWVRVVFDGSSATKLRTAFPFLLP